MRFGLVSALEIVLVGLAVAHHLLNGTVSDEEVGKMPVKDNEGREVVCVEAKRRILAERAVDEAGRTLFAIIQAEKVGQNAVASAQELGPGQAG